MNVPLTPIRFLDRALAQFGHKTGVIDGDQAWTYRRFAARCHQLAGLLASSGCRPGEVVAFLAPNRHELLEGYFGVPLAGAVLLPLNIRLTAKELTLILNDCQARCLIYDPRFEEMVRQMRPGLNSVDRCLPLDTAYSALLGEQPETSSTDLMSIDETSVAELFYTSGTTGRPKGVMLSHRNLYLHALEVGLALGVRESDVQLHTIPLFHVNGWGTPQYLTCQGGRHVLLRRFDPETVLQLIERHRVTLCSLVPTMASLLVNCPRLAETDVSSLRRITVGGAASEPSLLGRMEEAFGCDCIASYGLTEATPVVTLADAKSHLPKDRRLLLQSMSGWPIPGVELRIVDPRGRELRWDGKSVGELLVRGDTVMQGYRGESAAAVGEGGWLSTGDLATIDVHGYCQIVDRKKDIIVSGGENISSIEIERVLAGHPDVLECAVIPVPDPQWGETPLALVVLRSEAVPDAVALTDHCRRQLASFKLPRRVEFLASLPKGGTGKILKRKLREAYSARRGGKKE